MTFVQVLSLEIDHLKSRVESLTVELVEARSETEELRRNSVPVERERELRLQLDEVTAILEDETKKHQDASKTGQHELARLIDAETSLKRSLEESKRICEETRESLEREKKKCQELQMELGGLQETRASTESALRYMTISLPSS